MVEKKTLRLICACCCCPCWYQYYSFLNNTVRGCQICIDVFDAITSVMWKVLFVLFMWCCCGFQCMVCYLCIFSCIDLFGEPCQAYQTADTWIEGFHSLVLLKTCEQEAKIKESLTSMFVK